MVDIGCGAGMDLMLAAGAVGPSGHAIGIDMTEPMAERARASARALGFGNVEVRAGDALDCLSIRRASTSSSATGCSIWRLTSDRHSARCSGSSSLVVSSSTRTSSWQASSPSRSGATLISGLVESPALCRRQSSSCWSQSASDPFALLSISIPLAAPRKSVSRATVSEA